MTPRLTRALAALALLGGLSGCAADAPPPCPPASPATLRVAVANPQAPSAPGNAAMPPSILTNLPVLQIDDRGMPMAALARAWTTADRRTWTLTLHDHLRTHDNAPLTADRIRAQLLAHAARRGPFDPVARDIVGIDIPAPDTLVVRLRRPTSAFAEAFLQLGMTNADEDPTLSAGPFRLVQNGASELAFATFPDPGTPPPPAATAGAIAPDGLSGAAGAAALAGLAGLAVRFYPSSRAAWAAFLRHEADFLYEVPPAAAALLAQNADVQLYPAGGRHLYTLGFRLTHPLLRDVRVRQAINLAIDRNDIARRVLLGYSSPAASPFSQYYWALEGETTPWPYDPAAALTLLRAATGGRTEPIELICLTSGQYPQVAEIAAAVEAQLARVNIRLRLVALDVAPLVARLREGDFDVFVMPMVTGYSSLWPYIFWHGSTPQPFHPPDYTAADRELDALYEATSPDEERKAARAVVEVMRRDPPAAFIAPVPVIRAVRRSWRVPAQTGAARDIRRTIPRWTQVETPACRTP